MLHDIRRGWILVFSAFQAWVLLMTYPIDFCYGFKHEDFAYDNGYNSLFDFYYEFFNLLSIDNDNVLYNLIHKYDYA